MKKNKNKKQFFNVTLSLQGRGEGEGGLAFTLIELLAVISIILILIGFGIPAYNSWRNRGKTEKAKATIAKLEMAVEMYKTDFGEYPAALSDLKDAETSDNGPYIDNKDYNSADKKFYDPWGTKREYHYTRTNIDVTIKSDGPDERPNTSDDISNK